ncbi:MAG: hypothetical protein DWQ31_16555 [Planctomycetota bacterium]|nr:MAG: hypothetical protein DWQ31_16555 [Planctomycetota bacterium]
MKPFRTPQSAIRILLLLLSLLATHNSQLLLAANVNWIGAAQDVPQITTITIADTWASGDTATITCNNKSVTITCGATMDTPAEVAAGLAEALALTHHDESKLTADMTVNVGGRELGEFWDFDATVSGAVITLTSRVAGVPFTVTTSEVTAGDGTVGSPSTTQAATGKNHFNNAKNWSTGTVPNAGDAIFFRSGDVSVLYNLANTTLDLDLRIGSGYGGSIGLPPVNASVNGREYREYRTRYLALPITATTGNVLHEIGEVSAAAPPGTYYIDLGTNDGANQLLYVWRTRPRSPATGCALHLIGGYLDELNILEGSVDLGTDMTLSTVNVNTLRVGGTGSTAFVVAGFKCNFVGSTPTLEQWGGTTHFGADNSNTIMIYGGTLNLENPDATHGALTIHEGGTVNRYAGAMSAITVYTGGKFDATPGITTFTAGAVNLYRGATFHDPRALGGYGTNGLDFIACEPGEVNLKLPKNKTWTPSSL